MSLLRCLVLATFVLPILSSANGQEPLPRVLILGDSVYRQPAASIAKEWKGRIDVVYVTAPADEVLNSESVLERLDELLGDGNWSVIHFNVGLGDLIHRVANIDSFRVLPRSAGGVRATSPEHYQRNLQELVTRLKATEAKLIWASTTPIRASTKGVFDLKSEIRYNEIAAQVMKTHAVPINDMYTFVHDLIDMTRPAGHGADPFHFDKKPIHQPVADAILSMLDTELAVNVAP